jgi:hypothetical protein
LPTDLEDPRESRPVRCDDATGTRQLPTSAPQSSGGPGPVRRYLPDMLDRVWNRQIEPGKVFDLPLEQVADACRTMDERCAIKALL